MCILPSVRAGCVGADSVGASSEPAPTMAIYECLETAPIPAKGF